MVPLRTSRSSRLHAAVLAYAAVLIAALAGAATVLLLALILDLFIVSLDDIAVGAVTYLVPVQLRGALVALIAIASAGLALLMVAVLPVAAAVAAWREPETVHRSSLRRAVGLHLVDRLRSALRRRRRLRGMRGRYPDRRGPPAADPRDARVELEVARVREEAERIAREERGATARSPEGPEAPGM